jgi:hypothetical protein
MNPHAQARHRLSSLHLMGLGLLSACASAPPPATLPRVSLVCHPAAIAARFSAFGIPEGEIPRAVALSGEGTYVLFAPNRLLLVKRPGAQMQAEMTLGKPGETWAAMDVDPVDGALWVVSSDDLALRRVAPGWQVETVGLAGVEGEGGFSQVRVAADAIYVTPTSADAGVWRVSRQGRVLATEFPISRQEIDYDRPIGDQPGAVGVRLDRDAEGRVVARVRGTGAVHRVDQDGVWSLAPDDSYTSLAIEAPSRAVVKGIDVGGANERWYLAGDSPGRFFWKGQPAFLGPGAHGRGGNDTLLLLPSPEGVREVLETCFGSSIMGITTNADRYVAYTWRALIFGDFASAPDLP